MIIETGLFELEIGFISVGHCSNVEHWSFDLFVKWNGMEQCFLSCNLNVFSCL
jgi:hypothetical protein